MDGSCSSVSPSVDSFDSFPFISGSDNTVVSLLYLLHQFRLVTPLLLSLDPSFDPICFVCIALVNDMLRKSFSVRCNTCSDDPCAAIEASACFPPDCNRHLFPVRIKSDPLEISLGLRSVLQPLPVNQAYGLYVAIMAGQTIFYGALLAVSYNRISR